MVRNRLAFPRVLLALCFLLACEPLLADAELRLGVYGFDAQQRPAWLCPEVAEHLRKALSDELSSHVVLHWRSSTEYSEGAAAFNNRDIDIGFFDKLGPIWVARPSLNTRILDAFRAVVLHLDPRLDANATRKRVCLTFPGVLTWGAGTDVEFFYLDDLPGQLALTDWVRRFQFATINSLSATAAGNRSDRQ